MMCFIPIYSQAMEIRDSDVMKIISYAQLQELSLKALAHDWVQTLETISLRQLYAYALDRNVPGNELIRSWVQNDEVTRHRFLEILWHLNACEVVKKVLPREADMTEVSPRYTLCREDFSEDQCDSSFVMEIADGAPNPSRLLANSDHFGCVEKSVGKVRGKTIRLATLPCDDLTKILDDPHCLVLVW